MTDLARACNGFLSTLVLGAGLGLGLPPGPVAAAVLPVLGVPQEQAGEWLIRHNSVAAQAALRTTVQAEGFVVAVVPDAAPGADADVFLHRRLDGAARQISFEYAAEGAATSGTLVLMDAAANVLWESSARPHAGRVTIAAPMRGQVVFRLRCAHRAAAAAAGRHRVTKIELVRDDRAPVVAPDGFTVVDTLDELRGYLNQDSVRVRLKPGTYRLDRAHYRHFLEFTGSDCRFDLRGARVQIDNRLFREFGVTGGPGGFYCAFSVSGERVEIAGVATENVGDLPGIQSRNKIFNVAGSGSVLRDVDVTTSGSSPWGYGSLYGIASGDVRKMNGIRVGPGKGIQLIGCRVHMRAMGHAIFVQGGQETVIRDCHVDGLLRPTREILAETSGYAFQRGFVAAGRNYIEGVRVGADGRIPPDEMIALSEDGIRMYDAGGPGKPTGSTTIENCTVTRMRRGICVGLGPGADRVVNCEVRDCVAAGFNVGSGDTLEACRADAKYAEALSLPYRGARAARVDLAILDSRDGLGNDLLATINGTDHRIRLTTSDATFVPAELRIEFATRNGYAFYQRGETPPSRGNHLTNRTPAAVWFGDAAAENTVESVGDVGGRLEANGFKRLDQGPDRGI